jgi:hypothetical protein
MKLLTLAAWLLPVVLPFAGNVLAEHSIPPQARHYMRRQELSRRGDSAPLAKRVDNVKWSFYDAETGNEYVGFIGCGMSELNLEQRSLRRPHQQR